MTPITLQYATGVLCSVALIICVLGSDRDIKLAQLAVGDTAGRTFWAEIAAGQIAIAASTSRYSPIFSPFIVSPPSAWVIVVLGESGISSLHTAGPGVKAV